MTVYYLETSALLKKYQNEAGTPVIQELFDGKRDAELLTTSYFTVLEVTSVATRLQRSGTFNTRTYRGVLGNLDRDLRASIVLQPVSDAVVLEGIKQAMEYALRAPDAVQMATALRAKGGADEPFYFICSDGRLKAASSSSGLLVLDPEAPNALETLRAIRRSE